MRVSVDVPYDALRGVVAHRSLQEAAYAALAPLGVRSVAFPNGDLDLDIITIEPMLQPAKTITHEICAFPVVGEPLALTVTMEGEVADVHKLASRVRAMSEVN